MKYSGGMRWCADKPQREWRDALESALDQMSQHEQALLLRIAEARGRRVPLSELSESIGLPATPSLEHDFPGLSRFVAADNGGLAMPVVSVGTDDKGWYWMSAEDSQAFRPPLQKRLTIPRA